MERYLKKILQTDIQRKMIILSGPRQCGKTTLSKDLVKNFDYLSFDVPEDRAKIEKRIWDNSKELVIFDELHKKYKWKSWLKGIVDAGNAPPILVTGSARIDTFKKVGDSLAGRYLQFRLHPLDIKELSIYHDSSDLDRQFGKLMRVGGFPEPFFDPDENYYSRWQQSHLDVILRQDAMTLQNIRDVYSLESLVNLLKVRVGSHISINALAKELERDPKTIQRWIRVLEDMYVIFGIGTFTQKVSRTLKKAPKYYFFDNGQVEGDQGAKFENAIACSLLKEITYSRDVLGLKFDLTYIRTRDGQEVDFLVTYKNKPHLLIEAKYKEDSFSKHLYHFQNELKAKHVFQLSYHLDKEWMNEKGMWMKSAPIWLSQLDLAKTII